MTVTACDVPEGSLLARSGGPADYRDCFCCEVAGAVDLGAFVESFYCSAAFRPERIVLGLLGRGASNADARALARGEAGGIAVWTVVERRDNEILLEAKRTGTASWLGVAPTSNGTKLKFGSWVGNLEQSRWKVMLAPHVWYSRVLLASAARGLA